MPWIPTFTDEFNGPGIDRGHWTYDLGGGGWGNQELEVYTERNATIENGCLVITARQEGDRITSARLQSRGLFEQKYGRFEARLALPKGQGMWPAFWMLGGNDKAVGWPDCGEIDIMEWVGKDPGHVHGTVHGPGYSGAQGISTALAIDNPQEFHVYAVEWEPAELRFFVDGQLYRTLTPEEAKPWVFDHPFFMILNLAVGGGWPGNPDATTVFPQQLKVDYVRVYRKADE